MPPVDSAPAVLEAALLWVPHSVHRETALATVKCLLSRRKPMKFQHAVSQQRHNHRGNSNGAPPDATYGSTKAVVTIQPAEKEVKVIKEHVGGLTTSQVTDHFSTSIS